MSAIVDARDLLSLKTGGAIANLDTFANLITGGGAAGEPEFIYQHKEARVAGAAASTGIIGMPISMWQFDGTPQGAGIAPTSWANPTNTTAGGLLQANAGGLRTKWILDFITSCQQPGLLVVYDRLAHMGGLSGTTITAQNTNGGSAGATTRYTNGIGNQLWFEVYTQLGGTATTITASYTNDQGVAAQVTQPVVIGGTGRMEAQRISQLSLAAGDNGVQAVTSVTVLATTGTAGNFGVTIAHPIAAIPVVQADTGAILNFLNGPMASLVANACLAMAFHPTVGAAPVIDFSMRSVEI